MGTCLKYIAILTALVLFAGACQIFQPRVRESRVLNNKIEQQSNQLDLHFVMRRDSQSGYWLFWSDSTFRFHPDSGLVAKSGMLLNHQARVSTHVQNEASTAVNNINVQTLDTEKKEKRSLFSASSKWLLGLFLLMILVLLCRLILKRIFTLRSGTRK
ncbi:hypothetical protein ACK8HY_01595 [Sphingobacterium sp. NGMCC 1.201703]|uniref:hypothetical protein n=1 Tax=Sphingobacterium sp. NGMCC 1.201703 TaxID=3388657 RepID=UPI0039FD9065